MTNDNGWTRASPSIPNYTRTPCVIVSDAVTVLSNNWSDNQSSHSLSSRAASNTTINCSLVSGIVPTSSGNYIAGAENFIRLLEDWTAKPPTLFRHHIKTSPS